MQINKNFANLKLSKKIKDFYIQESVSRLNHDLDTISLQSEKKIAYYLNIAQDNILECYQKLLNKPEEFKLLKEEKVELDKAEKSLNTQILKNKNEEALKKLKVIKKYFSDFWHIVNDYDIGIATLHFIDSINKVEKLFNKEILDNLKILEKSQTNFADKLKKNLVLNKNFNSLYDDIAKLIQEKNLFDNKYVPEEIKVKFNTFSQIYAKLSTIFTNKKDLDKVIDFIDKVNQAKGMYSQAIAESIQLLEVKKEIEFADRVNKNKNLLAEINLFIATISELLQLKSKLKAEYISEEVLLEYNKLVVLHNQLTSVFSYKKDLDKALDFMDKVNQSSQLLTKNVVASVHLIDTKSKIEFVNYINNNPILDNEINQFYKAVANLIILKADVKEKYIKEDCLSEYNHLETIYTKFSTVLSHKKELNKVIDIENAISQYFLSYQNQLADFEKIYATSKKKFFVTYKEDENEKKTLLEQTKSLLKTCENKAFSTINPSLKTKVEALRNSFNTTYIYLQDKENAFLGLEVEAEIENEFVGVLKEGEKLHASFLKDGARMLEGLPIRIANMEPAKMTTKVNTLKKKITPEIRPYIDNENIIDNLEQELSFLKELLKMQQYVKFYKKYHKTKKDAHALSEFNDMDTRYKKEKFDNPFPYRDKWIDLRS